MSRRKPKARPPSRSASRRDRKASGARIAILGTLALATSAWLAWRAFEARRVPADPIERMSVDDAFAAGLRHGGAGHHLAALPYFRRAVTLAPDSWTARENYASTLYNGAQEARVHLGKNEPATRSSIERISMIRESLGQTEEALKWASQPADQALVFFQRAQAFHTFGFAIDALLEFRQAARQAPDNGVIARATSAAEETLHNGGTH